MKKLTTQATLTNYITAGSENNSIIESVISFIRHDYNVSLNSEKKKEIRSALAEAVNNAITYAYLNKLGKISVTISIYDNKLLKLKVRDYGRGIEDIAKAREPLFTTGASNHSGLGFSVMEAFSDKLTVKSTVGKGTVVTMEFKL